MNDQTMEELITTLYEYIQDARALPLGADKCILERDKVLDMLDEISAQLPAEIKQAHTIVDSRNELIGQARREAESIVQKAQKDAEELVSQQAIYLEAKRQCEAMVNATNEKMAQLRRLSNEYMDDALRRTEEAIAASLGEVRDTRAKFQALAEAQEKRSAAAEEN